jgi:hypothetical protein
MKTNTIPAIALGAALAIFARTALAVILTPIVPPALNEYSLLDALLFSTCMACFAYTHKVERESAKKAEITEDLWYIKHRLDKLYEHFLPNERECK